MEISAKMVKELRDKTGAGLMDAKKALQETSGDMNKAVDFLREKGLASVAKKQGRIAAEGVVEMLLTDDNKSGLVLEVNSETDFVAKNNDFIDFVKNVAEVVLKEKPADVEALLKLNYPNSSNTIEDILNEKVSVIGEKLSLRRFSIKEKSNGGVYGYIHGTRIAVLVVLESDIETSKLEELGKDISMQVASMNPKYIAREDIDTDYIAHEREILLNQAINESEEEEKAGKKAKPREIIEKMVEGRLQKELRDVCLLEQPFVKEPDMTVKALVEKTAKELGGSIKIAEIERFEVGEGMEKREEDFQAEVQKQMQGK
ncbi:MAG: elongation factor Ts [Tissierellia bacterium]|nr:elongation factor Ts [Tissierellia bacterium]